MFIYYCVEQKCILYKSIELLYKTPLKINYFDLDYNSFVHSFIKIKSHRLQSLFYK